MSDQRIKEGRPLARNGFPISRRQTTIAFVLLASLLSGKVQPAGAFSSYKLFGGAIHKEIIYQALSAHGVKKSALDTITDGSDAQDNPKSANFTIPERHACDNKIRETAEFIQRTLGECVQLSDMAISSHTARQQALYRFGEALHPLQDFYSHSNYLELLLRENKPLAPVDWQNPPAGVVTCFYHYEGFFNQEYFESRKSAVKALMRLNPQIRFHSEEEYGARDNDAISEEKTLDYALAPVSFTHIELNKDNQKSIEGRVFSKAQAKTYFELAKELAVLDTSRLWGNLETLLRNKYGGRAEAILAALKDATEGNGDDSAADHHRSHHTEQEAEKHKHRDDHHDED